MDAVLAGRQGGNEPFSGIETGNISDDKLMSLSLAHQLGTKLSTQTFTSIFIEYFISNCVVKKFYTSKFKKGIFPATN